MHMTDDLVKAIVVAVVIAHAGVLLWAAILRKGIASVIWLNLLISAPVVLYWVPMAPQVFDYVPAVWCFLAFELAVLATSLLAVFHILGIPPAVIWAEFLGHFLLGAAALVFILTFRVTRLI